MHDRGNTSRDTCSWLPHRLPAQTLGGGIYTRQMPLLFHENLGKPTYLAAEGACQLLWRNLCGWQMLRRRSARRYRYGVENWPSQRRRRRCAKILRRREAEIKSLASVNDASANVGSHPVCWWRPLHDGAT